MAKLEWQKNIEWQKFVIEKTLGTIHKWCLAKIDFFSTNFPPLLHLIMQSTMFSRMGEFTLIEFKINSQCFFGMKY